MRGFLVLESLGLGLLAAGRPWPPGPPTWWSRGAGRGPSWWRRGRVHRAERPVGPVGTSRDRPRPRQPDPRPGAGDHRPRRRSRPAAGRGPGLAIVGEPRRIRAACRAGRPGPGRRPRPGHEHRPRLSPGGPDHRQAGRAAGAAEYRLRRLINSDLGQRNFNAYLNGYRIDETKAALADRGQDSVPILTIALDAGFNSLGPFNRAFRAETGMTPTDFRRASADSGIGQPDFEPGERRGA
uniref:AraC family transcriptional regulator n=1 Tax=Phenylobacterium glaciei TaxID=2803784 RepID=A0A974S9L8_9CAUL|nr:AraC family transcriptional regulator [Phenylobacterium glaciei]